MLTPEDQNFEKYLKRFHPRDAAPLPTRSTGQRRRVIVFAALAAAAAVVASSSFHFRGRSNPPVVTNNPAQIEQPAEIRPLTLGSANALLANSPSIESALDGLAFAPQPARLSQGKRSALAELSKEPTL